MIQYRLYTEKFDNVPEIASKCLGNFTIFEAVGYYEGTKENSLIIEYIGLPEEKSRILELANEINRINNQICILISELEIQAELIYKK
jgi:hypothetical protein